MLIFEFARFRADDFERGREFVAAMDAFLAGLPRGWRYGVEIPGTRCEAKGMSEGRRSR